MHSFSTDATEEGDELPAAERTSEPTAAAPAPDEQEDGDGAGAPVDISQDEAVLQYLRTAVYPSGASANEKRRIRKRASLFTLTDGKLYRKPAGQYKQPRLVPPIEEREQIITEVHSLSHYGVAKTQSMLAERFYSQGELQTSL